MKISLSITEYSPDPGGLTQGLLASAEAVDASAIDTLWVADHMLQLAPGTSPDDAMLEAYTTLGYLAARTSRVRLGTMVAAATYRSPAVLLKAVSTLDVLSGGRAWLGLGAGYQQEEATALGLDLPSVPERYERLEELLEIGMQLWSGDETPFEGKHFTLERPLSRPLPVSRPHPPVLIGGMGEKRTLPLVAKYADACNLFDIPDGGTTIRTKLEVLRELCDEAGRPYEEIERTVSTRLSAGESAVEFAERCRTLAERGLDHAVVITNGPWDAARVEVLADAAAQLAD